MLIFWNICQIFLFLINFVMAYFGIEKFKKSDWFIKKHLPNILLHLFEGFLYGVIAILFQVWFYFSGMPSQPYTYIIALLVISFFRNTLVACYSSIPSVLFSMFKYPVDEAFYYIVGVIFITMILNIILKVFVKKNRYIIIVLYSFISISIFIMWLIMPLVFKYKFTTSFTLATLLPFALSFLLIMIMQYLDGFLKSANLLYESSTYDYGSFYRESYVDFVIQKEITNKKIKYGIYGIFEIIIKDKANMKEVLKIIENTFPSKSILFKAKQNQYGFFLPIKQKINLRKNIEENFHPQRSKKTTMGQMENVVNQINKQCRNLVKEKIRIATAIYGLQESIIPRLQNNVDFTLETIRKNKKTNSVILFNPSQMGKHLKDSVSIKRLDNLLNLQLISREFFPIYDLKKNKTLINISGSITAEENKIPYASMIKAAKKMGEIKIFESYAAAQTVISTNGWNKTPIAINYSIEKISDPNFVPEKLELSIARFNQKPKNIVLLIRADQLELLNNKTSMEKINQLKNLGFGFAVQDFNLDIKIKLVELLKPKYIMLDKKIHNEKLPVAQQVSIVNQVIELIENMGAIPIAAKIFFERELLMLLQSNIRYVGGIIFNQYELKPINFQKKSKIYIEELKKEIKNEYKY